MEAANEAARRAVNGILDAAGSGARRCGVWQLHEPEIFAPWRELDFIRYTQGLPWDDTLVRLGLSFAELADKAIQALGERLRGARALESAHDRPAAAPSGHRVVRRPSGAGGRDVRPQARGNDAGRADGPHACASSRRGAGREEDVLHAATAAVRAGLQIIPK